MAWTCSIRSILLLTESSYATLQEPNGEETVILLNPELDTLFEKSKEEIVRLISEGVRAYDQNKQNNMFSDRFVEIWLRILPHAETLRVPGTCKPELVLATGTSYMLNQNP